MRSALVTALVLGLVACNGTVRPRGDAGSGDGGGADSGGRDGGAGDLGAHDGGGPIDMAVPVDMPVTLDAAGFTGAYPGHETRTASSSGTPVPYDLYVPSSYAPSTPMPLVCLFHGQGDTGANIVSFWQPTADSGHFIVMATTSTGSMGGWSSTDVDLFSAALNDALGAYDVDHARIYVWGFSAGAHLVHAIALMNTDLFAAYGVNAGVLPFFAGIDAPSLAPRHIPVIDIDGTSDPLYMYIPADHAAFTSAGWTDGVDLDFETFAGGHELRAEHPGQVWAFVSRFHL